ncbi:hypothetical protein FE257_001367 [Aspergillus nanangensis]|uniref:N-acetyltransferase domain-containing protein n=1 Tax=Aspergillus nanangensis TaxID=2582783 RepID=A0AAD4CDV4_ASPNN|nr:hypothetical protein FE257_001367 [Aspergillus nanangensis]
MSDSDEVVHHGRAGGQWRSNHKRQVSNHPVTPAQNGVESDPQQTKGIENGQTNSPPEDVKATLQKDRKDELNQLRLAILVNAHQNHPKDLEYSRATPEALVTCRDGPGTDQNSEIYKNVTICRLAPEGTMGARLHPKPSQSWTKDTMSPEYQTSAQWKAYAINFAAYPIFKDGALSLSPEPTPEYLFKMAQPMKVALTPPKCAEEGDSPWVGPFSTDWEYFPPHCPNPEAFQDGFRHWLEETISIGYVVDIYHAAFFDGTAHPDGVRGMFMPDLDDIRIIVNPSDHETCLHQHETAQGYCYNWCIHVEKKEVEIRNQMVEAVQQRQAADQAYISFMKSPVFNPNSPKANIYLRPVENTDVPELFEIFHDYAMKSPLSTDDHRLIEEDDVRNRIDRSRSQKMPFIVAVERKAGRRRDNSPQKILGYALAQEFPGGDAAGRYTAELKLFVRRGYKWQGVGKCLIDKLLEVCDGTYIAKHGYFFDASVEERSGYESGGRRKLSCLIFTISYPTDNQHTYQGLTRWLKTNYQFEEQGVLKRARVKQNQFLDVSYWVKNIGVTSQGKFDF